MNLIEPEILDLTMTYIIGVLNKDGIVVSADGKATGREIQLNYEKIRPLNKDENVYLAISGGIVKEDLLTLLEEVEKKLIFSYPYSILDIANCFARLAKEILDKNKQNVGIQFLVLGYDKDESGKPTEPHIFEIDSYLKEYGVYSKEGLQYISIGVEEKHDIPFPSNGDELITYTQEAIKNISKKKAHAVGDPYKTIVIKKDKTEIIYYNDCVKDRKRKS